jgi:MerR family transcriptional regulator, mercuric resistance operon regulatory protein
MQALPSVASPLLIGQLATAADTAPDTIRYYERIGLLPRVPRTSGRQRIYGEVDLQRLRFIRRARALGFTLEAIGSLLALAAPGRRSCASVREIAARHLRDVQERLAELRRLERALAETVARCTGKAAPTCAVLSMLESPGGSPMGKRPGKRRPE